MPKEKATTRKAAKATRGKADGGRRKKDPNAPKRFLSGYMFFATENRPKVIEENPGIKFGDVGKVLGQRWTALDDDVKLHYKEKSEADRKRFEREDAAYRAEEAAKERGAADDEDDD